MHPLGQRDLLEIMRAEVDYNLAMTLRLSSIAGVLLASATLAASAPAPTPASPPPALPRGTW
jgi:hypothetical protein